MKWKKRRGRGKKNGGERVDCSLELKGGGRGSWGTQVGSERSEKRTQPGGTKQAGMEEKH